MFHSRTLFYGKKLDVGVSLEPAVTNKYKLLPICHIFYNNLKYTYFLGLCTLLKNTYFLKFYKIFQKQHLLEFAVYCISTSFSYGYFPCGLCVVGWVCIRNRAQIQIKGFCLGSMGYDIKERLLSINKTNMKTRPLGKNVINDVYYNKRRYYNKLSAVLDYKEYVYIKSQVGSPSFLILTRCDK